MTAYLPNWLGFPTMPRAYKPRPSLVLVNGLAEQSESWFANRAPLSRHFDVKVPEILVYGGDSLHRWIESGGEVTIDYLTDRLASYLEEFAQKPPYNLVGSSLGGQVVLTYALRYPELVNRLVLICPSGFYGDEALPMIEGVRRSQYETLVQSVFFRSSFASGGLVSSLERKFQDRRWKKGVLRTLRGTVGHSVAPLLPKITQPTLIIWGAGDRILSDVKGSIQAAEQMRDVRQVILPRCGHAPQIEKASLVNRLIVGFLKDRTGEFDRGLDPEWSSRKPSPRFRFPEMLTEATGRGRWGK